MANEITMTFVAKCLNGKLTQKFEPGSLSFDQTAQGMHAPVVVVGTSEEDFAVGDVTTPGWLWLRNLDTTNYVDYGPLASSGGMIALGRIEAGEIAAFRMNPSATLRWKANTAAVKVHAVLLQD